MEVFEVKVVAKFEFEMIDVIIIDVFGNFGLPQIGNKAKT